MGWHCGVWEAGAHTHRDSLERANRRLVDGLGLNARFRVLDVGCGMGDFARWCAREFGCAVTGISISPAHVELATAIAAREGLADRCTFLTVLRRRRGSVRLSPLPRRRTGADVRPVSPGTRDGRTR